MSGYEKPVSMLKVVTCVPPEANVAPQVIDDAMELNHSISGWSPSHRRVDVSLIQTRDALSAMAVASKVLIAARRQRREHEAQLMIRNSANSYQPSVIAPDVLESASVVAGATCTARCLLVPTTCSRSMAEHILDDLRVKYSSNSLLLVAIFAFPKGTLQHPTSLAPPLARAIQLVPSSNAATNGAKRPLFDENLIQGLHFGRARRLDGPFVELRGLVEYDALIDALFDSSSFKAVLAMCTIQVVFKVVDTDSMASTSSPNPTPSLRPQSLFSCWYLHPKHHDEFVATRTTSRHEIVDSSNQHLNLTPTTQHFRLRAPRIDVVVVMALTLKELLAMSSFAHSLIIGSGKDADLYIAPPTRTESFEVRRATATSRPAHEEGRGSVFDKDVVSEELIEVQSSAPSRSSSRHGQVQQALHLADEATTTLQSIEEVKLLQEIKRVGLEFDRAERRFQEAVAQRDIEKKRLAEDKRLLLEMRAELTAIAEDRSIADSERKELTLRLAEAHDELDRVEKQSLQHSNEKSAMTRERREASSKAEARRAEIIRQQDEDIKKLMQDHREELQRVTVDHQKAAETEATTEQHLHEQLQREHERKKDEWRRAEEGLTRLLATATTLNVQLDELKGELALQRRGLADVEAKLRSCGVRQDISATSAFAILGHERERLDRTSSDAVKLRGEAEQKKKTLHELEQLTAQRQSELDALQTQLANLRFDYNTSSADHDAECKTLVSQLPQYFFTIEAFRRMQLRLEEDHSRLRLRHEEVRLWSTVLHATELRFIEAAKRECRDNVFAYDSRFKALEMSKGEALAQLVKAQSKLDATRKQHREMDEEMRRHLITARDEERSLSAFVKGRVMPSTGSQFPSLVQDEQQLSESIGRIRECLSSGCVVLSAQGAQEMSNLRTGKPARSGLDINSKSSFPMAANRSKTFHVAVSDLREQLEFLVEATKEDCEKAVLEHRHSLDKLAAMERDLEERKAILDRAVLQTSQSEKQLATITASSMSKTEEIVERKRQHEAMRKQLQEEYMLAQETAARHRRDGLTHLRHLKAHEEKLQQQVSGSVSDLSRVQDVLDTVTAKHPEGAVTALRLRIEREKQRHEELKEVIAAEMALMSRSGRWTIINETEASTAQATSQHHMTPRPGSRGGMLGIVSPAP